MQHCALSDDLWLCERCVFLPAAKTLVISDLQLGEEQQLRALGHNIRYEQATQMFSLLERLIERYGARRLVINGDLKHEFGRISAQERRDVLGLLGKLQRRTEIIVVRGNHDTITKPLTDELGVEFVDAFIEGSILCVHGHQDVEIPPGIKTIIIGHMHPAITLDDGVRKERFKCFVVGKHARRRIVVLPSFATLSDGANILALSPNTPLLTARELERSEVFVIGDEIRRFGRVGNIANLLVRSERESKFK